MKKRYFNVVFAILVLCSMLLLSDKSVETMKHMFSRSKQPKEDHRLTVVIDAGHGGFDPGKVGVNGALEKDINLSIAMKLKDLLELNDLKVVMLRTTDEALHTEGVSNKKASDLKKRVQLMAEANPVLAVSIHQNSFPQESSYGSQVFYYTESEQGKEFAQIMQATLKECITDGNHRLEKPNKDYYLLKKSTCPLIIVECGFLSNHKEADLLVTEKYQREMAWAIHLGVMRYLNTIEQ
ncbi:N-acetylmuramoyl-L-alanine amidase [Lachnoclostridium phytofermentans]|uniref:Cell wall hydrolase/autolysin n=1 Tax=Lachnoclostridium phytofermentans (strain ATCC 700394 / DSM 18823 / ISDg) TaxID=357809 RepID=A9KKA4_LACP7|nr:N-acetylmuramoyl-L-alanine amidase [Lachnoclostridium phytofermentans]ABX44095.1 cell wall hydrolase/autolysin [Lachnoclostridium phytofermentans ISDg]